LNLIVIPFSAEVRDVLTGKNKAPGIHPRLPKTPKLPQKKLKKPQRPQSEKFSASSQSRIRRNKPVSLCHGAKGITLLFTEAMQ